MRKEESMALLLEEWTTAFSGEPTCRDDGDENREFAFVTNTLFGGI